MKKSLLSIAALVMLSVQGFSQITISEPGFGTFVNTTDRTIKVIANSFVAVPGSPDHIKEARPTGYTWDIQAVYSDTNSGAVYHRHVATTGYEYADSTTDGFNTIYKFPTKRLTNITATGIIQPGERISRTAYSLASLTGADPLTDSLIVLDQEVLYYNPGFSGTPAPRTQLKLPATLSTTWQNNYFYKVRAAFTYVAQGYQDDTIERRRYIVDNYTVVGYGNMKVRHYVTPFPWSQYNNVLQTRAAFIQIKDSFFINDVAATPTELGYFGLTQGVQTTYYRDYFYRTGEVVPFVEVHYTDASLNNVQDAVNDRSMIHADRVALSVKEVLASNSYAIYPNPVQGGGVINFEIKEATANGKWEYNLINITGQQVAQGTMTITGGKTSISVPKLSKGIYYIQATDGDKKIVKAMDIE